MEPLDLRTRPPRAPRAELAGVVFLPRTIDKARALLPGGQIGDYEMAGFSAMLLEMLEIPENLFLSWVAEAADDETIASHVEARSTRKRRERWNAFVAKRESRGGNRAEAIAWYPWLAERPDLTLALDVLAEDDRLHFGAR